MPHPTDLSFVPEVATEPTMLSPQQRAVIEFWAQFMRGSAPSFHELYCDSLNVSGGPFSVREVLVAQVFT